MLRSLLQKEWIKLRRFFWLPPALVLASVIQAWFSIKGFRSAHGPLFQYSEFITNQPVIFSLVEYALVFSGIWYAAVQFYPECTGKRLRLLFHLPVSYRLSLYTILAIGVACCLMTGLLAMGSFGAVLWLYGFPEELVTPMLSTMLPWLTATFVAYCATAATLAEPRYFRRFGYALCGALCILMLTPASGYGAGRDWGLFTLICLPWFAVVEAAALRVKEGN